MRYYRLSATILFSAVLLIAGATTAHAAQYASTELGTSMPAWTADLPDINASGDVAWTEATRGANNAITNAKATFTSDGGQKINLETTGWSAAMGISKRYETVVGNVYNVWVSGYKASSPNMLDSTAMLWKVKIAANGTLAVEASIDLGAITKLSTGVADRVKQSAAYGLYARGATEIYVVGFSRDKVSNAVLPRPTIWKIVVDNSNDVQNMASGYLKANFVRRIDQTFNPSSGQAEAMTVTSYGNLTGIAPTAPGGTNIVVCGTYGQAAVGATTPYANALCWNAKTDLKGIPTPNINMLNALKSLYNDFFYTSTSSRVRLVNYSKGTPRDNHVVVVGSGAQDSGLGWVEWLYDVTNNTAVNNKLAKLAESRQGLGYDVSVARFPNDTNGAKTTFGITWGGVVITSPSSTGVNSGPGGMGTSTAFSTRGALRHTRATFAPGPEQDMGKMCLTDADSTPEVGFRSGQSYDQILAFSPSAGANEENEEQDYRIAMAGGKLYRLSRVESTPEITIQNNPLRSTRPGQSVNGANPPARVQKPVNFDMNVLYAGGGVSKALVRVAKTLACEQVNSVGGTTCNGSQPAAFEVANDTSGRDFAAEMQNGKLRYSSTNTQFAAASTEKYVQVASLASGATNACGVSPIMGLKDANQFVVKPAPTGGTYTDIDGKDWTACGSDNFVDTTQDFDHCGTCNNAVDKLACGTTQCVNSTPSLTAVQANKCAVGSSNDWSCYADSVGDDKQYSFMNAYTGTKCGNASNKTVNGVCERCESGSDPYNLTNTQCCNASGVPQMDVYDRTGSVHGTHAACSDASMGLDRNSGYSQYSVWFDPRGINGSSYDDWKQYTQNSNWSIDGVCNLKSGANTEPQNLDKSSGGSPGYVRRVRANLTPKIDERDWYAFQVDDSPNDGTTPKPRVRVRSHGDVANGMRKARLEVCMYIDCMIGDQGKVKIKDVRFRGYGRGKFYTSNTSPGTPFWVPLANLVTRPSGSGSGGGWHEGDAADTGWLFDRASDKKAWMHNNNSGNGNAHIWYNSKPYRPNTNSPAYDARGGCFQTDDQGYLDMVINDYDCTEVAKEEAWVYVSVNLPANATEGRDAETDSLTCQDLRYTMFYGNDRNSSASGKSTKITQGWNHGCDDCCDDDGNW